MGSADRHLDFLDPQQDEDLESELSSCLRKCTTLPGRKEAGSSGGSPSALYTLKQLLTFDIS